MNTHYSANNVMLFIGFTSTLMSARWIKESGFLFSGSLLTWRHSLSWFVRLTSVLLFLLRRHFYTRATRRSKLSHIDHNIFTAESALERRHLKISYLAPSLLKRLLSDMTHPLRFKCSICLTTGCPLILATDAAGKWLVLSGWLMAVSLGNGRR